jgi:hypothetical protein
MRVTKDQQKFIIKVIPIKTETWKKGVYIFGVAVEAGGNKGQAQNRL